MQKIKQLLILGYIVLISLLVWSAGVPNVKRANDFKEREMCLKTERISECPECSEEAQSTPLCLDECQAMDQSGTIAERISGLGARLLPLEGVDVSDLTTGVSSVEDRLVARRIHFKKACQDVKLPDPEIKKRGPNIQLAYGKLRYCGMEKVASSFMKRIQAAEPPAHNHTDAKTLVIVREPYSRLVSGFIDKINTHTVWGLRRHLPQHIVRRFRKRPSQRDQACGSDVTFPEFIRYFISTMETEYFNNEHWRPMHQKCQMCSIDYDYYVHLETLSDDLTYIYGTVEAKFNIPLDSEKSDIEDKARLAVTTRDSGEYEGCEANCTMLGRAWSGFRDRGFIAADLPNPVQGTQCDTISQTEFIDLVMKAHETSKARIDKRKQKRQAVVDLFLQVTLLDRLKVREILMQDFKFHGYDPTPPDLFPELY